MLNLQFPWLRAAERRVPAGGEVRGPRRQLLKKESASNQR
jgi:hypothetical protein